jgi:hypothetical protein
MKVVHRPWFACKLYLSQDKTPFSKLWLYEVLEIPCDMQETLPGYETLPSNAEFAQANTQNCASGLGMLSQALNTTTAKSHTFKHYIFMNSYVRGPFLPNYLMVRGNCSSWCAMQRSPFCVYCRSYAVAHCVLFGSTLQCYIAVTITAQWMIAALVGWNLGKSSGYWCL